MKTNRLAQEKSPYLLQHQHNPVDWMPWGEEAFEKARREDRPIFLSIGYSTCHWCHVMERESFENEAVAQILNENFVPIKVDREERPDVDRVYMTFVQATTGSGGWPMSVWLTPGLKPFLGGTYFPPSDRWGKPGFASMLRRIVHAWKTQREQVVAQGEQVIAGLREYTTQEPIASDAIFDPRVLRAAYDQIANGFDPELGGFSHAPKFPRPATLNFLFRYYAANSHTEAGTEARDMALFTLQKMADGGMNDQLGGGFHRYSVDRYWHVPHFEKMLYDQGQLVCSYVDAFQITGDPFYAGVARGTLEYVLRDLRDLGPDGGAFYSAEDADSPLPENPAEKGEGAFYVWTQREIEEALEPEAAALFVRVYGVEPGGNSPEGSDPHGELQNKNTLIRRLSDAEAAEALARPADEIRQMLNESRQKLFGLRSKRPRPHLDDKIITAWNGLMISALARAGGALAEERYIEAAEKAAGFIRTHLYRNNRLLRSYRQGPGHVEGFADDYAFLISGLLDLYEATGQIGWLQWALELQQTQDALFYDAQAGGYFSTGGDDPAILIRLKEDYDGAEPSPNSVAALNTLRLSQMLDDAALRSRAEKTIRAFSEQLQRMPMAMPQMLAALDFALQKPRQFVFAGKATELAPMVHLLHRQFLPNKVIMYADNAAGQRWLGGRLEFIRSIASVEGKPSVYICEEFQCQQPLNSLDAFSHALTGSATPASAAS